MIKRVARGRFAPGCTGNPHGRPRKNRLQQAQPVPPPVDVAAKPRRGRKTSRASFIALARSYGPEALERLVAIMRSDTGVAAERAARLIIERGFGPAPDAAEISSTMTFGKGLEKIEVVFVKPKPQPKVIEGRRIDEPPRLLDWPPSVH